MRNLNFLRSIKEPIFYITNDVAKGIGLENLLPNYHIVCLDDHPLVDYLLNEGIKIFCLEKELKRRNEIFRSTSKIINHPLVLEYIKKESGKKTPAVLYFKPSAKIDLVCKKFGFKKLGNSAALNRVFEDKVIFYEKCLKEGIPVPEGELGRLGKLGIFWDLVKKYGSPLVIQFGRGWAGSTTFFVKNRDEFNNLQKRFYGRKVRITKFIKGKTILNNACIFGKKIFVSPPAEQINSVGDFTSTVAGTCGRQWPADISSKSEKEIEFLTKEVGKMMAKLDYKGFFGLDFLVDEKTERIFITENNARLTASVPFFTKLEIEASKVPLLAFHLLNFYEDKNYNYCQDYKIKRLIGSEILARNNLMTPVKVGGELKPGIYRKDNMNFTFLQAKYYPQNLKEEEFWLTTVAQGRIVNPEIEIVRAIFKRKVLDKEGKLDPSITDLILKTKEKLNLKKC